MKLYILIIGDEKNQIHMEGYQVSNQCMALVRDGCLVPTKDAPELGYVIESTDKQYVPDVFYKVSTFYLNISDQFSCLKLKWQCSFKIDYECAYCDENMTLLNYVLHANSIKEGKGMHKVYTNERETVYNSKLID